MKKVDGKENIADLFTKYLKRDDIDRLLAEMGMWLEAGRSDIGLKISAVKSSAISNSDRSFSEDATVDSWMNLKGRKISMWNETFGQQSTVQTSDIQFDGHGGP